MNQRRERLINVCIAFSRLTARQQPFHQS